MNELETIMKTSVGVKIMAEVDPWLVNVAMDLGPSYTVTLTNQTHTYSYVLNLHLRRYGLAPHGPYWTGARYRIAAGATGGTKYATDSLVHPDDFKEERFFDPALFLAELQTWLPPLPYMSVMDSLEKLVMEMHEASQDVQLPVRAHLANFKPAYPLVSASTHDVASIEQNKYQASQVKQERHDRGKA